MSGFEIVGVVLGAFPLLVSALEHWRDAYKTAGLLVHFEAEHRKHLNDVKDEELKFKLHLELLLQPLLVDQLIDQDEVDQLLAQPGSADWEKKKIKDILERRLQKCFIRYMEIMQELQESIFKMIKSLGPGVHAKVQASQDAGLLVVKAEYLKAIMDHRFRQLKFSLNREGRKERVEELRNTNEKLSTLLEANDKISKVQHHSSTAISSRASKSLVQYWKHAGRIYALFQASWGCPCKKTHCAHLWLHHPQSGAYELKVLILWARNEVSTAQLPPWKQQGLSITWIQGALEQRTPLVQNVSIPSPAPAGTPQTAKKQKKQVKFFSSAAKPVANTVVTSPSTTAMPKLCVTEIQGLCKLFESCGMDPLPLGVLTDQVQGQRYSVSSEPDQKLVAKEISLKDALTLQDERRLKPGLPRIQVALAVASAHLQLHSTPWARRQWEAKDVLFPQYTSSDNGRILFDKPYVSADFEEALPTNEKIPKTTDRSFGCLGIILLELWYGYALESHEIWQKSGLQDKLSDPVIRSMVASRWADDVRDQAGAEYASAVSWCLRESPTTLEGTEWRQDLAEKVVMRLERCRDWLKGGNTA